MRKRGRIGEITVRIEITSLKDDPDYAKCPRCWHYTGASRFNYDNLCDKCCDAIVNDYPDHEAVPGIKEAYRKQREQFGAAGEQR